MTSLQAPSLRAVTPTHVQCRARLHAFRARSTETVDRELVSLPLAEETLWDQRRIRSRLRIRQHLSMSYRLRRPEFPLPPSAAFPTGQRARAISNCAH